MLRSALEMFVLLLLPAVALAQNQPPVADAGEDQTIFEGESAQLSGSATDPDGDPIVAWTWTIESSPAGSSPLVSGSFTPTPILVPDLIGDHVVSLVVFDGIDDSLPDTVTVSVIENLPPVAIADADVTSGPAPLTVHFDASQSYDPEGADLILSWNFGDGTPTTDEVSPVHVYDRPGEFIARLTVIDDKGQPDQDALTITVLDPAAIPALSPAALALLPAVLAGLGGVMLRSRRCRC